MKQEKSCGAVCYTKINGLIKYVLISSKNEGKYGFPKGHMEGNETEIETALREIKEETNLEVNIIDGFRMSETYLIKNNTVNKESVYYLATYQDQNLIKQDEEVKTIGLFSFEEALELISFDSLKNILIQANNFIKKINDKI